MADEFDDPGGDREVWAIDGDRTMTQVHPADGPTAIPEQTKTWFGCLGRQPNQVSSRGTVEFRRLPQCGSGGI